ncbi:glycogen debranching N-terminal domain-containing protein, partial [Paraburkholderia sp. SIMBA_030]|uniref:glycogen debranching N-terminal domain-containing protein n=1 Tax=Paraburkholderia sp. SIMBA_030 TaxID=3085773 RepID=UPI00397B8913
ADGKFDTPLAVQHERHVGPGLRDDIVIRNYSAQPATCRIDLALDADLEDLFDIKGGNTG